MTPTSADTRQLCYFALIAALFLLASGVSHAQDVAPLGLGDFLSQVKTGNTGTRGAIESSVGEEQRKDEGALLLAPTAFANAQYAHDGKPQIVPIVGYSFQDIPQYSLGVSKLTDFGLQMKLSTNLYALSYENPSSSFFTAFAGVQGINLAQLGTVGGGSVNITNQLDLTQSLWGNGFGASTRASQTQTEAQALSQSYNNRYAARTSLVAAETAYWNLVTSRQSVALTRDNLDRAQKTYDWNVRRAHLQLADQSDALQSQAQLEQRRLDYQNALDNEVTASRAFNTARGVASDEVKEALAPITPDAILAMAAPKRAEFRDDVKAAEQQSRATTASSEVAREKDKPTLDVFATLALNGQDPSSFSAAYGQAFAMDHPTAIVGIRFQAPLTLGTASSVRSGYTREEAGAELNYQRKVFEQEQGWKDLASRLDQAKHRLQLAVALEKVQQEKLFHERERYRTGRTTAFQVLTFETDYAQSELNRIISESDVLGALSQMKLYGEEL